MESLSDPDERSARVGPGTGIARAVVLIVVVAAVGLSYAPNLAYLAEQWSSEPNYSHGFLVGPIAALILWRRWAAPGPVARPAPVLGLSVLFLILAARAWLFERNEQWAETATLIPALVALTFALGGRPWLRRAAPSLAFLIFALPLPPRLNLTLAAPLQRLATVGSMALLQATGLPVLAQGNVIIVGSDRLEVAQACNGLSMLLSFVTLITAMVVLLTEGRPVAVRLVVLLSAIPIALIANILRITATAWAYHLLGAGRGEKIAHDLAGWAMMPVALVLALVELKVLDWLIVPDDQEAGPPPLWSPSGPARQPA